MRKYDMKNKRNIGIIIIISIVIIIMFSLCIYFFSSLEKKEYQVSPGSIVFDKDKSPIKTKENAIIKTKWNKDYYLIHDDNNYDLGKTAIAYDENTGYIYLYGRYYEISSGIEINVTEDETIIKSSALTKFYKLADRKYLVIDKDIKTSDGLLSTSEFLMIDLDKVGNATLTNHKVNLKAFSETTIVTSNYTFDIASEILTYGSDKIDLKKIIGSSNTYTKKDLIPEENPDNNSGSTNVTVDNPSGTNGNGNGSDNQNKITIEEIKKATKKTSIIQTTSTIDKIKIDYVIYDPKKEYTSVYMEVATPGTNQIDTIYLNSASTSYELANLTPNTAYQLTFKYSYVDEENNTHIDTFDTMTVTTKMPSLSIKVTRINKNKINYLITPDSRVTLTSATLIVLVNNEEYSREKITINGNTANYINIANIQNNDFVELRLENVETATSPIKDLTASDKFRY